MRRRSANSRGHRKQFSRTAIREHSRNAFVARGGFRL